MGGTPVSVAYAIDCGTSRAQTPSAATASRMSNPRQRGSHSVAGTAQTTAPRHPALRVIPRP